LNPLNVTDDKTDGSFTLRVGDGHTYSEQVEVVEAEELIVENEYRPRWRIVYADRDLLARNAFLEPRRCDLVLRLEGDMPPSRLRLRMFYDEQRDRFLMTELPIE
jgi:hypothetical protein